MEIKKQIKEFEDLMKIQGLFTCSCGECIELRKKWRKLKKTFNLNNTNRSEDEKSI
jgi:hypothetical protein